jgi:HlyD family secretion protein
LKKKVIIISLLVFALIGLSYFLYSKLSSKSTVYFWREVNIERGNVTVMVTATGAVAADISVDVGVQVSGIIAKLNADFNDVVRKGQVIAILDTTLYYTAKVDAAANLSRAQIALSQSEREYIRSTELFASAAIAKADNDLARTAFDNAKGNVTSAKAMLNRASINLTYCRITAPISGVVISRNVQVGNMVIASFNSPVLFNIANTLTNMQVQANVDEADIGLLREKQRATFTVDAYPNEIFKGVVTQIRHQPVLVQNVVNYVVIIEVDNRDLKLMPGLTANANIFIEERNDVLKVATNAFNFIPPLTYLQTSNLLSDSIKKSWIEKLRNNAEIKKQEIIEADNHVGVLWLIKGHDLFPVRVSRGLNDGSFTEVRGNIHVEDAVASGINTAPSISEKKAKSPFMPSFPSKKK